MNFENLQEHLIFTEHLWATGSIVLSTNHELRYLIFLFFHIENFCLKQIEEEYREKLILRQKV